MWKHSERMQTGALGVFHLFFLAQKIELGGGKPNNSWSDGLQRRATIRRGK